MMRVQTRLWMRAARVRGDRGADGGRNRARYAAVGAQLRASNYCTFCPPLRSCGGARRTRKYAKGIVAETEMRAMFVAAGKGFRVIGARPLAIELSREEKDASMPPATIPPRQTYPVTRDCSSQSPPACMENAACSPT